MPAKATVRIIASGQLSDTQGHDLLSYYLEKSSWKVSEWTGSFTQRAWAKLLRYFSPYRQLSPKRAYQLFLANWLPDSGELLHFIWGDAILEATSRPERGIFTLHQPWEHWTELTWKKISECAGIICMAEPERDEINRRCPQVPCTFIPHGINIDFWCPLPTPPKRQICAAGMHLRNLEMLLRVAHILLERHPDITFRWLVNPNFKLSPSLSSKLPPARFEIIQNLSADQLHQFLAESWLFCIPYNNVAASNAIVEALACGTPVFTTSVGGMASYAGDGIITMVENNDDTAMVAAVTRCLASAELRNELSSRSRQYAVTQLSWPIVVEKHAAFYKNILHGTSASLPPNRV